MNEMSERPFRGLLSRIAQYHPQTACLLEALQEEFGTRAAFHASEVIFRLQTRVDSQGFEAASVLTEDDMETLPYFEIMQDNLAALERLVDVLECYAAECEMLDAQAVC